ncbi:MAG: sensor histidine kinase [Clostridia bacterium]|nr:sensor histidine kinase [Clostridia bacterium]
MNLYSFIDGLKRILKRGTSLVKLFRNIKIQARLILLFLILSLIPILITGFFSYKESSNAIESKISTYSVQVMSQVGENIERELAKLENDSVEIEFSDKVQNTLLNYTRMTEWEIEDIQIRMKDDLVKKFSFLHDVSDVLIYTNDRNRIIAYGDKGFKLNFKKEYLDQYLKELEAKEGAPIWTGINLDFEERVVQYATSAEQMSKSNGILIGRAIKSLEQGDIIGTLIIRTNERFFSNIYRNIDIGHGADIFVIDADGIVVSSRNPQIPVAKEYKDRQLIQEIQVNEKNEKRVFNYSVGSDRYLVAFTPMVKAPWYVVSTIPYTYLNSESERIWINILYMGLGCFLLAVLLSYVFSLSISRPLKKLVKAMNEAKKGNLAVNIRDTSKDEIGEVTGNFNQMLNDIRILMDNVKNKEKQKRKAELKALQAQISPHFLSNTLNTVKWLAGVQKAENIENIITSLIQLLHVSMGKGGDYITIREEIEYIKNYINIQEFRYYNKFKVTFEIEEEIMDYRILKFLLQPVVENSLIHGIEPMEGQGLIVVKGFRYEDCVKITVTDNGVGIPEEKLENILNINDNSNKSRFSGIGISNVNERIRMNFGDQFGLQIESVPNLYTTVEITLPVIKEESGY